MTDLTHAAREARDQMHQAVQHASPFVRKFARFGYAAKGVLYVTVGVLAAWAALGNGESTGSKGALQTIVQQPFGQVLLGIVALGLACYAIWQFVRAVEDPEREGNDARGIGVRIGAFISGIIHLSLVVYAVHILAGSARADDSGNGGAQSWSATIMSYPAGRIVLAAIGAGIVIYGIVQLYRAFVAKLDDQLALGGLSAAAQRWVIRISRLGIGSRGVVFGIIGTFLILAAWHANAGEARGVGGALQTLQQQPFGPWLLGAVALGLIAYGIYEFVRARYRRIDAD